MSHQHSFLSAALDALKEPLFVLDEGCRCVFANAALFSLLEVKHDDVVSISKFWPDSGKFLSIVEEFSSSFVLSGGERLSVKVGGYDLGGGYRLYRVIAVGARNDLWQHFHQQRLETLGLLAGGVAHDFNNILTGILGHVSYLKTILPSIGSHLESIEAIETGAKKSSVITQQILKYSKLDSSEDLEHHDLGLIMARTCSLLRGAISPSVTLRQAVPHDRVGVLTVEAKVAQVIVNLVMNARDALAGSGIIDVGVALVDDEREILRIFRTLESPATRYAKLFVSDSGQGISAEIQSKIFDPFFTTKRGVGTGLGLTTVASIVKLFRGAIEVQSMVGVGTTVSVYFPMEDSVEERRLETESPLVELNPDRDVSPERGRILVVDDELPVRNVVAVSLQHLGYSVEMAASGNEALQKFREVSPPFDLVILDMLMPQMAGDQVFERLREICPDVRVLIMSGFASEDAVRRILDHGGKDFIQKPFTIQDLSLKVKKCLS